MYTMEGTIEIPMNDFWEFVIKYAPVKSDPMCFGVPRFDIAAETIIINFASDSEESPENWTPKPKAITQWAAYDAKKVKILKQWEKSNSKASS